MLVAIQLYRPSLIPNPSILKGGWRVWDEGNIIIATLLTPASGGSRISWRGFLLPGCMWNAANFRSHAHFCEPCPFRSFWTQLSCFRTTFLLTHALWWTGLLLLLWFLIQLHYYRYCYCITLLLIFVRVTWFSRDSMCHAMQFFWVEITVSSESCESVLIGAFVTDWSVERKRVNTRLNTLHGPSSRIQNY